MTARPEVIASELRQRIRASLHIGALQPGDRLPSVRALARRHGADLRAVLGAYHLLADERLVQIRPRSGIVVAPVTASDAADLTPVDRSVIELFTQAFAAGTPPAALQRRVRRSFDAARIQAACVECNLDQLHALRSELERDYGIRTRGIDVEVLSSEAAARALAPVDIVVTTRFHEDAVRQTLGANPCPLVVVSLSSAFRAELSRRLAQEPLYFLCTDPRFAAKVPRIFGGQGDVRPVVLDPQAENQVPARALVFAMDRALERLPADRRPRRLFGAPRVFSTATARELIAHIVRVNLQRRSRDRSVVAEPPIRS